MALCSPTTVFEFSATTIRVCRCVTRRRKRILTHCFSFSQGRDEAETQGFIRAALKKNALKPENVILSLPRYAALARLRSFPTQDSSEIDQIAALYAARESSHHGDEVCVYDYQHVGFDRQGQALVQMFFIKKACVSSYMRVLKIAGITPERVTLNTQGLSYWGSSLKTNAETEVLRCVPVLNIDDHVFDFNMFVDGKTLYSRSIPSHEMDLSVLAKEVKVSFQTCRRMSNFYPSSDTPLYVTGKTDGFDEKDFESLLSCPVETFNPVENLNTRSSLRRALKSDVVSYACAIGLALGAHSDGIDITPEELTEQKMRFSRLKSYRQFIIFATIALLLSSLFVLRLLQLKEELVSKRHSEIQRLLAFERSPYEIKKEDITRRVLSGHNEILNIFSELYRLTPASVFLTEFVIDDGDLIFMNGSCVDPELIRGYLKVLKESPFFPSASLQYMHQSSAGTAKKFDFKITFGMKK